jgi:transposase
VVVVNPKQFQVICKSVKKTDRNDARTLAVFLSKDMLPETRLKSKAESELASLDHTRDVLVKQRTRLVNKIHALHVRHGIKLKRESLSSRRALTALDVGRFSTLEQVELKIVRDQVLGLMAATGEIDAATEKAARDMDGYDSLVSIKGIGPRSAAVLLSGIGSATDFDSADKLAAYLGIVPRVSQSNDTDHRGRITKRGNRLMRTTLVQYTLITIRHSGYLNAFYRRIRDRRGPARPSSRPHANCSALSSTRCAIAGSSRTFQTSKSRTPTSSGWTIIIGGRAMSDYREASIGIDVAKLRNAIAVAEAGREGEVRFFGEVDAAAASMRRVIQRIAGRFDCVHFCYEAARRVWALSVDSARLAMNAR